MTSATSYQKIKVIKNLSQTDEFATGDIDYDKKVTEILDKNKKVFIGLKLISNVEACVKNWDKKYIYMVSGVPSGGLTTASFKLIDG